MLAAARTAATALPGAQLQPNPTLTVGVQLVLAPGLTGRGRGAPGQLSHTKRGRWPTGRRHSPRLPSASPAVACAP